MHAFEMLINYQERSRIDDQRCDISSFIPKVRPHTCLSGQYNRECTYVCGILRFYAVLQSMFNMPNQRGLPLVTSAVGIQT